MYVRPIYITKNGKRHAYWELVKSVRTPRGPRQRTVAYIGDATEDLREGVLQAAQGERQGRLFDEVKPEWVEVDLSRVRAERMVEFGGPWLGWQLMQRLGLDEFLTKHIPPGREEVAWPMMATVLVLSRLCKPSSELEIAEHFYRHSAMADVLSVPARKVNEDRLYRAMDHLLPHKAALQTHLKQRLGELFGLSYDLMLYDVTSTYFEGEAAANDLAKRGYSRDSRPDCKQVCIGLIVSKCGMPAGYEVFAGNRSDVTTLPEMVTTMEARYGRADRIWAVDRGMISEDTIDFLKSGGRRYIVGTPRAMLRRYERQLTEAGWEAIREGLEVKLCPSPEGGEVFILCRSTDRKEKEKAMHERFEQRLEEGLRSVQESCARQRQDPIRIARRLGKLFAQNSRAAKLFDADVHAAPDGRAVLAWKKNEQWRDWATLSEGCYLLRSNVLQWSPQELWQAYMQLTEAEAAFRIHKSDLAIRPIWHQKAHRVQAHILVCFLAYVLWKTMAQLCTRAGLGDEPRRIFEEISELRTVDILYPTRSGITIRRRYVCRPDDHQQILLEHLGLTLPRQLKVIDLDL
ncbi:MAG: IS1634 family transposase [Planctomycetes bacterium]|nr:IS1634 family transposase [Planctomycetota bacterium]